MQLRELFVPSAINLDLAAETKDEALKELVSCLGLDGKSEGILYKMLKRRENLGSTGIGRGIAIPHCRSLVVTRLRVAFGRKLSGLDFKAIDEKPVRYVFLIVAPPLEVSNQYLPVLGKIARRESRGTGAEADTRDPGALPPHRRQGAEGRCAGHQRHLLRLLRGAFHCPRLRGGSQSSRRVVRVLRLLPLPRRLNSA